MLLAGDKKESLDAHCAPKVGIRVSAGKGSVAQFVVSFTSVPGRSPVDTD